SHMEAIEALERLYQESEQYEALAQILLHKASKLSDSPALEREHLFRAARIYEEVLQNPAQAIEVYERVLQIDGEDLEALDKLIELNLLLERWEELLKAYERKADLVSDIDEKKRIYVEVGAVYERELNDPERAIDAYERILELDPGDSTAIQRLDALYQALGRWADLKEILERGVDLATDVNEVASYRYRIGELLWQKLNDPVRAVEEYATILEALPDHEAAIGALEAMIAQGVEPFRAAKVLEPVYEQAGDAAKLAFALEVQVRHEEDLRKRVELLHRIAVLAEVQLGDARRAFEAYLRALRLDDSDEHTLSSLERLADELGAHLELAHAFDEQALTHREERERLIDLAWRAAVLYEQRLGDVGSAIARYRQVVEADPSHVGAFEALDRLYEESERWRELIWVLEQRAQLAQSAEEAIGYRFRRACLYRDRLGDLAQAIEGFREILNEFPEHEGALSALEELFNQGIEPLKIASILEPLYESSGRWEQLLRLHESALSFVEEKGLRFERMRRIAEIAELELADVELAYAWRIRILLEQGLEEEAFGEAERLAAVVNNWVSLADAMVTLLGRPGEPASRLAWGQRLARIYENELNDLERATQTWMFVLSLD
ncbi:MAG: tetratricopeptide repeat protein, partial [Deltaproteobacteria bacterium]|nr:tetratricopeptide repeat protein [Deltaproteobacteria bacterium]